MSEALNILHELRDCGVDILICPDNQHLCISPRERVPPELLHRVRQHKQEVLSIIASQRRPHGFDSGAEWRLAALQTIHGLNDHADLADLYEMRRAALKAEHDDAEAEELAFGELIAEAMRRGIDVKAASTATGEPRE